MAVAAGLLAAVTERTQKHFYSPPPVAVESPLFSYVQ